MRYENAQVFVDFPRIPILPQQSPEHPLPSHPKDLCGHTSLRGTLPLTRASVSSLALRGEEVASACARVDCSGLDNDPPILDELLNVYAGVGVPNLCLLGGVEPDFALADASDGGG